MSSTFHIHGLMEPLGHSHVLQYLKVLAKQHTITLISFERPIDWQDNPVVNESSATVDAANPWEGFASKRFLAVGSFMLPRITIP